MQTEGGVRGRVSMGGGWESESKGEWGCKCGKRNQQRTEPNVRVIDFRLFTLVSEL